MPAPPVVMTVMPLQVSLIAVVDDVADGVIASAALTVIAIEAVWTPVELPGSTTLIVPVQEPAVVGEPVIAPVVVENDRPSALSVPVVLATENVLVPAPPLVVTETPLQVSPTAVLAAVVDGVIASAALTVTANDEEVPTLPKLSVAEIVPCHVPAVVGVPVMAPVEVENDRPSADSDPDVFAIA